MMDIEAFKKRLGTEEGRRDRAYIDTEGHPTVGVGFNLDRPDARAVLAGLGLDYLGVRAGNVALTDGQIDALLDHDARAAIEATRKIAPCFDTLPAEKQLVLADMVFNMGAAKVGQFQHMLAAVERGDWNAAAEEMKDSLWYHQVGQRAVALCAEMRAVPAVPGATDDTTATV